MKKIFISAGTRPNFVKITQFRKEIAKYSNLQVKILYTSQHYDKTMSSVFLEQFHLKPDYILKPAQGKSAAVQIKSICQQASDIMKYDRPDLVLVVGDVNATLAVAKAAYKNKITLGHVESGLRSFDLTMPEERNRIFIDQIADYCFVTEKSGVKNLLKEGKPRDRIFLVGNTMIDTLLAFKNKINQSNVLADLKLKRKEFGIVTMHRPDNVDTRKSLKAILEFVEGISQDCKLVFPIHPRTLKNLKKFKLWKDCQNKAQLILTAPLDYFAFQKLIKESRFVLTDSGGIQEETTYLRVPCLTFRENTERPVTIEQGTNKLMPFKIGSIQKELSLIEQGRYKKGSIPAYWDGKASGRIVKILVQLLK